MISPFEAPEPMPVPPPLPSWERAIPLWTLLDARNLVAPAKARPERVRSSVSLERT